MMLWRELQCVEAQLVFEGLSLKRFSSERVTNGDARELGVD
jgi:hypothetical protein